MGFLREEIVNLWHVVTSMKFPTDYIDIILVAVLLYFGIRIIRDARAGQLLKGIIVILVVLQVAKILNLSALSYLIDNLIQYGFLAVIVVFQPELRTALEKMGRTDLRRINIFNSQKNDGNRETAVVIDRVCECVSDLSAGHIGGLIVFEMSTRLGDVINTGIRVDSEITAQMLGTIFFPKTPLHDGAVVIRDNRIASAGCLLPLTQRMELSSSLGTRHRAAVGISEVSDAITVVVSEETGHISYTRNGEIKLDITADELKAVLLSALAPDKQPVFGKKEAKK